MAHKKAGGSSRNGRDSPIPSASASRSSAAKTSLPATSSCVSAVRSGIRAPMSASARIIPFRARGRQCGLPYEGQWPRLRVRNAENGRSSRVSRSSLNSRRLIGPAGASGCKTSRVQKGRWEIHLPFSHLTKEVVMQSPILKESQSGFPSDARPLPQELLSPQLQSERLTLRAPETADAHAIAHLANNINVASKLSRMPHPYTVADAANFIARVASGAMGKCVYGRDPNRQPNLHGRLRAGGDGWRPRSGDRLLARRALLEPGFCDGGRADPDRPRLPHLRRRLYRRSLPGDEHRVAPGAAEMRLPVPGHGHGLRRSRWGAGSRSSGSALIARPGFAETLGRGEMNALVHDLLLGTRPLPPRTNPACPDLGEQPMIRTGRLTLRPFAATDAPAIRAGLDNYRVAKMLARVPQPYHLEDAEDWLAAEPEGGWSFAITLGGIARSSRPRPGPPTAMSMTGRSASCRSNGPRRRAARAGNLGYWLAEEHWGRGLMTEAVNAVLARFFSAHMGETLYSQVMDDNPASLRIQGGWASTSPASPTSIRKGARPCPDHPDRGHLRRLHAALKRQGPEDDLFRAFAASVAGFRPSPARPAYDPRRCRSCPPPRLSRGASVALAKI